MTETSTDSDPQEVVIPLDSGGSLTILSAAGWLARTGQGDHESLAIGSAMMPEPAPTLEPEDADPTKTQPELADNS